MIELPKSEPNTKRFRKRFGYCQYKNCNKEFYGHSIRKYCDIHTLATNRKRVKVKYVDNNNQILKHKEKESAKYIFKCALEKCNNEFQVIIYPKIYVYPKYCENHRQEHRRSL